VSALKGGEKKRALEEIGEEIENVRASWRWAISQGRWDEIDRSQESLYLFYEMRSWAQGGRRKRDWRSSP